MSFIGNLLAANNDQRPLLTVAWKVQKAGLADCFRIIHRAKIPSLIHLLFRRPCFESYYINEIDFPSNLFCYKQQYVHSNAKPVLRLMIDFCLSNAKKALVIKRAPEIIVKIPTVTNYRIVENCTESDIMLHRSLWFHALDTLWKFPCKLVQTTEPWKQRCPAR